MATEFTHTLLSLYRGELAAVSAYEQALERFADQPEAPVLERLRAAHEDASERLAHEILAEDMVLPEGSAAWGSFTTALESVVGFLGDDLSLQLLQLGEQIGVRGYERALADLTVPRSLCDTLGDLMVDGRQHVDELRTLRERALEAQDRPMI